MRAKIIAKNYNVIKYELNGKARYIVEHRSRNSTTKDMEVFCAIDQVGFKWKDVTNYLNKVNHNGGLDKAIERHTIL